jgi:hypothetical protein
MRRQTAERIDDAIALGLRLGCLIWIVAGLALLLMAVHFLVKFW